MLENMENMESIELECSNRDSSKTWKIKYRQVK